MAIREKMRGIHPRLDYNPSEAAALIERISKDPETAAAEMAERRAKAEEVSKKELMEFSRGCNMAAACGQMGEASGAFTGLYMLGDRSYVDDMKRVALHFASFDVWCNPYILDNYYPWHSDLNTTMMMHSMASVYDIMYDEFTEEERQILRTAIMEKAVMPLLRDWVLPGTRIHALDSMGHNWWAVCIGAAVVGLCAVYEDVDGYEELLDRAMEALRGFCDYKGNPMLGKTANFDELGMFYESALYFNYGIGELCRCLGVFRNCFDDDGESEMPILHKAPQAFLSLAYPITDSGDGLKYLFADFGDSNIWIGGHSPMVKCMIRMGLGDENLKRFFNKTYGKPSLTDLMHPWMYETDGKPVVLPDVFFSENGGICTVRTSQENDATMLAVRCGYTWNHAHADAGSFIVFRNGEPVICDSASAPYGSAEYTKYFLQWDAHNVMAINGEGMRGWNVSRGNRLPGRLRNFVKKDKTCYFTADCTGPTSDQCFRNLRNFFFLNDDLIVTADDLTAYEESGFSYLLHYKGEMTEDGSRTIFTTARNKTCVDTVVDEGFERESKERYGTRYAVLNVKGRSRTCVMFNVISFGGAEASVTPISENRVTGCEIRQGGNVYRLYYNREADSQRVHENSINVLGGWLTDAYMLCDVNDGEEVLAVLASFVRKDGRSYYENLTKQTVFLSGK